ncbi:MAG: hypothetical protein JWM11_249, partial [Planctomycetaceae bacterium]|nr:hypothetical protein [Planctomycetaceae bacterium]
MAKRQIPETDDLEIVPDAVSSAEADVAKHERRTFAFKMLAGGVVACILPFVGLTIKGLPAEGCFIVGLIFVLIGFVALLTSFSSKVDRVAVNGTKVVMYGIIGFFGLIFVAAAGFLVFIGVGPLLFAKPQPAAPIGPVNPIFAGPQMPAVPGVQGAPAGQKMITISDLSAGLQARAALESTTPATFDQVAAKFLTGGNPDEVQQTLNYLGSKKPSGPHDQISAALIALMNRPGASLSDIMQICRSLGTWGVAGSYADLLKWAKSASSTQRLIVRRALKDLRTANPNATEILNPEAELGQLALA